MRRLSAAGFKQEFARRAVLPDWWSDACAEDELLLPDIEIRVARFVGVPVAAVRDPSAELVAPRYARAQLRRVKDVDRDRLGAAIHAATQISSAVVRTMGGDAPDVRLPPPEFAAWRAEIVRSGPLIELTDLLRDLWSRGIPVIQLETLPRPLFQGMAWIAGERPVVVVGHRLDEPARLAFVIAHEVGHIVNGDCAADAPVIDEEEEVTDDHESERRADEYAIGVLTGGTPVPSLSAADFKDLATKALQVEKKHHVDAAAVIWSWARRTGDYALATMASRALYRNKGGKRAIRAAFDQSVDLDAASETDRALLRCVAGDPENDAAAY